MTPRTAAGRALLADVPHRPWRRDSILDAILAIEAEAAVPAPLDALIDAALDKYAPGSHPDLAQAITEFVRAAGEGGQ